MPTPFKILIMAGSKNSTLAIDCEHLEKLQKTVLDYNKKHPLTPTNGKNLIALAIDYMDIQGCEYLFEPIFEKQQLPKPSATANAIFCPSIA